MKTESHANEDDDQEKLALARSPRFHAILAKSRHSIRAGKGLSSDEFWDAVEKRAQVRTVKQTKHNH